MAGAEYAAWVTRIFGSWDAYRKSLPNRLWVRGLGGWYSVRRGE